MSTLTPPLAPLLALLCPTPVLISAQPPPPSLPEAEVEEESYAAYSALIRHELGTRDTAEVLISVFTRGGRDDARCLKPPEPDHEVEYKDQISEYLKRNHASYRLLAKFDIGRKYELVDKPPPPEPRTPRRYISLSALGFNAAQDRSVVYMEYGGMGGAYFLTKIGGKWTVDFQRQPRTCGWIADHVHPR